MIMRGEGPEVKPFRTSGDRVSRHPPDPGQPRSAPVTPGQPRVVRSSSTSQRSPTRSMVTVTWLR